MPFADQRATVRQWWSPSELENAATARTPDALDLPLFSSSKARGHTAKGRVRMSEERGSG